MSSLMLRIVCVWELWPLSDTFLHIDIVNQALKRFDLRRVQLSKDFDKEVEDLRARIEKEVASNRKEM